MNFGTFASSAAPTIAFTKFQLPFSISSGPPSTVSQFMRESASESLGLLALLKLDVAISGVESVLSAVLKDACRGVTEKDTKL